MIRKWFAVKDLAGLPGMPNAIKNIIAKAKRESWKSRPRKGRGGGREYHISSLPLETRLELDKNEITEAIKDVESDMLALAPESPAPPAVRKGKIPICNLPYNNVRETPAEKQYPNIPPEPIYKKAMTKAGLLQAYLDHLKKAPRGTKTRARQEFIDAYNTGLLYETTYKTLGPLSWKSIERWKQTISHTGDALNLADMRGHRLRGRTIINREQAAVLLGCVLNPNRPRISAAVRQAKTIMDCRDIPNGHSESTYRRWLSDWKGRNYHLWVFLREGEKALNDKVDYYIERDYDKINVGDILVADGHVLNFDIINPWTGKPKRMTLIVFLDMKSNMPLGWEIMPTENTQAISAALRRAIIALGKMPQVVYLDNGRAFKSRFFNGCDWDEQAFVGVYSQLGIRTIFAWAYHGQSKTVERFFGTFSELETWMPTYVGTSIDRKPPRLNRGERLHRRLWERATSGVCPTLVEAHQAVSAWFDTYACRPQRGHLAGRTPISVFDAECGPGVNKDELSQLMLAQDIKRITRAGITFRKQNYYHPELYGRTEPVVIRYDLLNETSIMVYDQAGQFICEASTKEKVHPAAQILGDEADQQLLSDQIKLKKGLSKTATGPARKLLEAEILPAVNYQLKALGITGQNQTAAPIPVKPELSTAEKAAQLEEGLAELRELNRPDANDIFKEIERLDGDARYEKLIEIEVRNLLIPGEYQAWMRYYEQTPGYQNNVDHYETLRAQFAVAWQCEQAVET